MPTYKTTGIVIGRTNFGEADRVVRFLTADQGKVSAVAKGVHKVKSRSGGHLEPLGEVNLTLATGRNLDIVASARLAWYPHHLVGDYNRLGLAFAIVRMADQLIHPDQPAPEAYTLVRSALGALESGANARLVELWFKLQLAGVLGYRPELNGCVICGQHDSSMQYSFSPSLGGIVCRPDSDPSDRPVTTETIKFWRLLCDYPYGTIAHIAGADGLAETSLELINEFYEYTVGNPFKPTLTGESI